MERENFYLLLDLTIDPPETNPEKIDAAIKKMQAEWSRYRNHPSKAIQAKRYIGLIPQIREIMLDPQLREKEALAAKELFKKKKREKYAEIDRHLEIRMSKGYITEEEIFKLARLRGIKESEIRYRVQQMEQQKFAEIDKHLAMRMAKGFISEDEISKLAKLNGVAEDKIRSRVKCPIRKEGTTKTGEIKLLDQSILKVIDDNLKIVGQSSLYKFLDLPRSADLETLQKKARAKETELHKIGKKDALVTAGSSLIGQCLAIFKSEESRGAYDASIAQEHLTKLNSDIDVAGMDGKIRVEYFETLVKRAVEFGMDREEARQHIEGYCRKKKWTIEYKQPRKPAKRRLAWVLLAVLVLAGYQGIALWTSKSSQAKDDFQTALLNMGKQAQLEEKLKIVQHFLNSNPQGDNKLDAEKKMLDLQRLIRERDFESVERDASLFRKDKNYEKAESVYKQFLLKYPDSDHARDIKLKLSQLDELIEDRDYTDLAGVSSLGSAERIVRYSAYLEKYPQGKHTSAVEKFVDGISEEFYFHIKNRLADSQKQENWAECIRLCNEYITYYAGNNRAVEMETQIYNFQRKLQDQRTFAELMDRAKRQSGDYEAAKSIYVDYLKTHPGSPIRSKVEKELENIKEKSKLTRSMQSEKQLRALLQATAGRFVEKHDGAVADVKTGLVWSLLDSQDESGECMDYASAVRYVNDLRTGGYQNWRLPTASELAKIYKSRPFFPSLETRWYWTSESYARYSDGWSKLVNVVTSKDETGLNKIQKDSRLCGAVRAVRP